MSGFDNDVVWADNVDFRGVDPPEGQITTAGELIIGTGSDPALEIGNLTSPDSTLDISYSDPNITLQSGNTLATSYQTDNGTAIPSSKIINIAGGTNVTTQGSGNQVTINSSSNVTSQNSTYTAKSDDYFINCTANTFTVTLPTASGITGKQYQVKNSGSGTITVDGNGSETIDGELTQNLIEDESITIISDGSNWFII